MARVQVNRSNWRNAIGLLSEEVRAFCVEPLVQEEEVVEGDAKLEDDLVAVVTWLDGVVLRAVLVCAGGYVGGNWGRGRLRCWGGGCVGWDCVFLVAVRLKADGISHRQGQAIASRPENRIPCKEYMKS